MSKLIWKPVSHDADIASLGRNSSFYFLQDEHLSFLFMYEGNEASVLIISFDEYGLTIYHDLKIESDKFISKITGNNDFILMLDVNGDIFYLMGIVDNDEVTFNFTNITSFLSYDVILTWCKLDKLPNCLAMEGTSEGAGFIYHDNQCVYFTLYAILDVNKGLSKLTTRKLNYFDWNKNYFMVKIRGENAKVINNKILKVFFSTDEVLLIVEPNRLRFSKPERRIQVCSKPFPIESQRESIISIINFNKKGCIFIIYKSGKIICVKLKTVLRNLELRHLFIGEKVYAVTGYEDDSIKLVWSDLKYIYMSTVSADIESTKLEAIYKIGGVLHVITSMNNFLMLITRNACLYETRTDLVKPEIAVTSRSDCGLLRRIHRAAKFLGTLIEKIKVQECFIDALQISKIPSTSNDMYLILHNDSITLQNNTKCVFMKKLWRVQIEIADTQRKHLEIRDLHADIVPNGSVKFKWRYKNSFSLKFALFCDIFLPKAVIFIEVKTPNKENITFDEESDLADYSQYLVETYEFLA